MTTITLEKGMTVKVVKGRKVPIGTVGRIFWLEDGQWGLRIGLKDILGNVHWTAANNVEVTEEAPQEDARPDAEKPVKGSKVRHGDNIGIVFWYGRGRDGSYRVGYNIGNSKDAHWADAAAVAVVQDEQPEYNEPEEVYAGADLTPDDINF